MATAVKTDAFRDDVLKWFFQGTWFSWDGTPPTSTSYALWLGFHNADPGELGTQLSQQITATYGRQGFVANPTNFPLSSGVISNGNLTSWSVTAGADTASWLSVGKDFTGAGRLFWRGELETPFAVSAGVSPVAAIGDLTWTDH